MSDDSFDPGPITMVKGAVHNPAEPRHFMRLKPVAGRVRILRDGEVLAESENALRVIEVGKDLYDPMIYLPERDVRAHLSRAERSTHCPLKGDAVYFDLLGADGTPAETEIAWAYPEPIALAAELAGRVAFYPRHVTIEESPR